ncbi:MAG: rRNA methyltransferase [Dehalococcoidia bacterium]
MGRSGGGGMGFAFRGASPPWPYVGRGRGGLPRCGYYLRGSAPQAADNELESLKSQAAELKGQLEQIEARMRQLENEK